MAWREKFIVGHAPPPPRTDKPLTISERLDRIDKLYQRAFVDAAIAWYLAVRIKSITFCSSLVTLVMELPPLISEYSEPASFKHLLACLVSMFRDRTIESIEPVLGAFLPMLGSAETSASTIKWSLQSAAGMGSMLQGGGYRVECEARIKYLHMLRDCMADQTNHAMVRAAANYLPQVDVVKPSGDYYHCPCCKHNDAKPVPPAYDKNALTAALEEMQATYQDDRMWSFTKKRPCSAPTNPAAAAPAIRPAHELV